MNEFKVGDFVIFKSKALNALTGGTPKEVIKTNGTKVVLDVFIGTDSTHYKTEFDFNDLIIFKYGKLEF